MPQATLSAARLGALLPRPIPAEELERLLFDSKAELKSLAGDELRVESTADRLDLLCEAGLAAHLAGALGAARGPVPIAEGRGAGPTPSIVATAAVDPIRPAIAAIVIDGPDPHGLDAGLLNEAVRFQELIHATLGRDRRAASLGIYPADRLAFPLRYDLEPMAGVRFTPLDATHEVAAATFFGEHPMGRRFAALGTDPTRCLTLRDATGGVLSLPPVLNARPLGEAAAGDRRLLLEATGTRPGRVADALALLSLVFLARGWAARPVEVRYPHRTDDGRSLLAARPIELTTELLREVSGQAYPTLEVEQLLGRARLAARPTPHGWRVEVPPWRPDLLTARDVIEEIVLARGVRAEDGLLPPSPTRGRRLAEVRFRRTHAARLLGLGFVPLMRPVLSPEPLVRLLGRTGAIALANPVSEQYAVLRDALQVSLLAALERNTRFGYPQRLSEVGPVVVADRASETGADSRVHAAIVLAGEGMGFADAAAAVDYLLRADDVRGVREPAELAGTIPGRGARLRLAGEIVAEVGEIHPRILAELKVPVPVAWGEVDLTALWPLVRRPAEAPTLKADRPAAERR